MKTEGTNLLLLTISAFWPLATKMSSRRQRSIQLGGRYRQVSLYELSSSHTETLNTTARTSGGNDFVNKLAQLVFEIKHVNPLHLE